jgi:hypothetical protein
MKYFFNKTEPPKTPKGRQKPRGGFRGKPHIFLPVKKTCGPIFILSIYLESAIVGCYLKKKWISSLKTWPPAPFEC